MARTDRTKSIDPSRADSYAELGRRLMDGADLILELGEPGHASALAILSIHAVIAFSDAATIHRAGRKSRSADHEAGLTVLSAAFGSALPASVVKAIRKVVSEKSRFEYQGYVATMAEGRAVYDQAKKVRAWVEAVLVTTRRSH